MIEAATRAIRDGHNQYPPGPGIADLRQAVAEHQERFYGLSYDPDTEVLVTAGATEAIAAAMLALLEAEDEVVLFEPYYDSYAASRRHGRCPPPVVPCARPWDFDLEEFAAAITPRTRLVLLNTPHNPTGKVFSAEELAGIARVCVEADLLVVTDEVYEHLVFEDGMSHWRACRGCVTGRLRCSERRKDVLLHWLEDRLDHRCRTVGDGGANSQAVPDLRERCSFPAGGGCGPPFVR